MRVMIGVIGGSTVSKELTSLAEEVGKLIALKGAVLVCGGMGGVMEASAKGAKSAGGFTVGIIPGAVKTQANPYIDVPIVTGMGEARNVIVVRSSDAVIAIGGRYGTLSEIAFALNFGVPVVGLETWGLDLPILRASSPDQAVEMAFKAIKMR